MTASEFRLTKGTAVNWFGMFSYSYSHLRGNYTRSNQHDVSARWWRSQRSNNNSRAFDESYFQFSANGTSLLEICRRTVQTRSRGTPTTTSAGASTSATDFGVFPIPYEGSPCEQRMSNVGYSVIRAITSHVYPEGRQVADISQASLVRLR
jgi:hypothetical protein